MRAARVWTICLLLAPATSLAQGPQQSGSQHLDWELQEAPAGPALRWLRGARDGTLGLLESLTDLQLGLFSESSLLLGTALMASSDLVGVIDDNPLTQHVFKSVASKSLAQTAYLLNLAGTEAVLGSHGLEKQWYVEAALARLNPLLDSQDAEPRLLLEPLDFFEDRMLHVAVYRSRVPGVIALAALASDGLLRPVSCVLRIAGLHGPADALRSRADDLLRRAIR